jgi:hypothetical protein
MAISTAVIRLLFCLGTHSLDLRKAAMLLSKGKTMFCKLYTVVMPLKLLDIMSRKAIAFGIGPNRVLVSLKGFVQFIRAII